MQAFTVSLMARTQAWCALVLCAVVLNAVLAYTNLRRLERLPANATVERAARVNRAIALQAVAGLCSVALLVMAVTRRQRDLQERMRMRDLCELHRISLAGEVTLASARGNVPVDATAVPVTSPGGDITGAVMVVRDASDRTRAERMLESSRTVFSAVLDALPTQVALLDRHGVILDTNAAWRRFGDASGMHDGLRGIGANYLGACRNESRDGAEVADGIMAVIEGERPSFTAAHRCSTQPPLWLQMHVATLGGPGPARAVVAYEDVSDRVRSQSRMQRQSDQLRRLADIANLVNTAQDVRSVLGLVTAGACEIIGAEHAVTHVTIGGANGLELDVEAPDTSVGSASVRSGPSVWRGAPCGLLGRPERLTGRQLLADPEWRAFLIAAQYRDAAGGWMGAPLVGRDGRPLGVLHAMKRDGAFTEPDESIAAHLARLAAGAIENAWLYEELREGDRRKDEFLATLAHELRNPLAPMRNAIEIIRRSSDDAARGDAAGILERQVLQMVRLIDDLLDISRITKGKLEMRPERVDLGGVIRHAAESSRPTIDAARHHLVLSLPLEPVFLQADYARLSQVFANLLNNAAKYSEPGGTIDVSLEISPRDAIVRVSDSGMGITPEMLPRVFDMFAQDDHSLERAQGGLGIGLTLVRSIVELHGGRVEAASAGAGLGSCFTVRLPTTVARKTTERPVPPGLLPAQDGHRARRILVVDDNADSADSLSVLLGLEGHDVRTARDGPSAIDAAQGFAPEVALLDIGLPGMSGYDVARALRAGEHTARCLLVALTGWGQEADRIRSREAGFDHHLVKPLDLEMLRRVLQQ